MIFFRHTMEALLNPFFLLMVLMLWFILRPKRYSILLIFIFAFAISTEWLAKSVTQYLENRYSPIVTIDTSIPWIVVFSGGQTEVPDRPSYGLLYSASIKRLLEGVRLWRMNPDAHLLLSGGGYGFEKPEAQRLAELAQWFAIPTDKLAIEEYSINTADQAKAIKAWVHDKPFYLVTSAIHMPRAMALCKEQGLNPIAAPTDFTLYWSDERWQKNWLPNAQNIVLLTVAWHEILGMAWSRITGLRLWTTKGP